MCSTGPRDPGSALNSSLRSSSSFLPREETLIPGLVFRHTHSLYPEPFQHQPVGGETLVPSDLGTRPNHFLQLQSSSAHRHIPSHLLFKSCRYQISCLHLAQSLYQHVSMYLAYPVLHQDSLQSWVPLGTDPLPSPLYCSSSTQSVVPADPNLPRLFSL